MPPLGRPGGRHDVHPRHCRTRPRHPQARDPQHRDRGRPVRRRRPCAGGRRQRGRSGPGGLANRRRGQGAACRRRDAGRTARRERHCAGAADRSRLQPPAVPGHRTWQERRPARGRQARRGADQRRHPGRRRRHVRAADLCRKCDCHGAVHRQDAGDHGPDHRFRRGAGQRRHRPHRNPHRRGRLAA